MRMSNAEYASAVAKSSAAASIQRIVTVTEDDISFFPEDYDITSLGKTKFAIDLDDEMNIITAVKFIYPTYYIMDAIKKYTLTEEEKTTCQLI